MLNTKVKKKYQVILPIILFQFKWENMAEVIQVLLCLFIVFAILDLLCENLFISNWKITLT